MENGSFYCRALLNCNMRGIVQTDIKMSKSNLLIQIYFCLCLILRSLYNEIYQERHYATQKIFSNRFTMVAGLKLRGLRCLKISYIILTINIAIKCSKTIIRLYCSCSCSCCVFCFRRVKEHCHAVRSLWPTFTGGQGM